MDSIPPELLRYLIPFLPLTSLITARGVNSTWRALALTAPLYPACKVLLDLYFAAIAHPKFPRIAQTLRPHVREFDREAYVTNLTCVLPELFELWILEWPSNAVYFWAWPGLPKDIKVHLDSYCEWGNSLSDIPPKINTIPLPKVEAERVGQGLGLWETRLQIGGGMLRLWLIVDANETIRDRQAGRLVWTHSYYADEEGHERDMRIFCNTLFAADSLVEFLSLLDLTRRDVIHALQRCYFQGIHWQQ